MGHIILWAVQAEQCFAQHPTLCRNPLAYSPRHPSPPPTSIHSVFSTWTPFSVLSVLHPLPTFPLPPFPPSFGRYSILNPLVLESCPYHPMGAAGFETGKARFDCSFDQRRLGSSEIGTFVFVGKTPISVIAFVGSRLLLPRR